MSETRCRSLHRLSWGLVLLALLGAALDRATADPADDSGSLTELFTGAIESPSGLAVHLNFLDR